MLSEIFGFLMILVLVFAIAYLGYAGGCYIQTKKWTWTPWETCKFWEKK